MAVVKINAAFRAWSQGSGRQAPAGEWARPVASGASLREFEVVQQAGLPPG